MTGTNIAVQDAGNAMLAIINEGGDPFADLVKDLNQFFGSFMKIDGRTGDITYKDGDSDIEIELPARFWVNVESMVYGYNCWVDDERVDSNFDLWVNKANLIPKNEMKDYGPYEEGDGWQEFISIHLIHEDENGDDIQLTYQASSAGGKRAIRLFLKDYMKKIRQHLDSDGNLMIPQIEVDVTSSTFVPKGKSKKVKTFSPSFSIVDWADVSTFKGAFDSDESDDSANYEDEKDSDKEKPKKTSTRKPKKEKEEEVTDIDPDTGEEEKEPSRGSRGRGRGRGSR